jgi:cytochrome c
LAARRGHGEIVTVLVDQGADVNAVTRAGTALQIAARGNHVPVVETLLARGADPNIAGGENMNTPLHDAAERGSVAAARLLLEQGADVNRRNDARHPAIHLAAVKGHDAMVSMLREYGAAPISIEPLAPGELADADAEEGKTEAILCSPCHALEQGSKPGGQLLHRGPDLWNIVGRDKAIVADYAYSPALESEEGVWNYDELNRFVADPTGVVAGTKMSYSEPDRVNRLKIIAYLRMLANEPRPID